MHAASSRMAISWSGGKDGCLALLRVREAGMDVITFLTMCEPDGTSKSHALAPDLMAAQVARLGGQWLPVPVPAGEYASRFDRALTSLKQDGHDQIVFGDIDLRAHRDWLEPACARAGLIAVFPLWGERRAGLAEEVLRRGIQALVVGVDTARLPATFCGASYDRAFLDKLPPDVCPCGEDGEFHTFVFDAPGMDTPVSFDRGPTRIVASAPPLRPSRLAFETLRLRLDPGST